MTHEKGSKRLDTSHIAHSFSRSGPRREIYLCLCGAHPGGLSAEEISVETGYDKEIIMGALVGNEGRYKPEDALVTIGLATISEEDNHGQKITVFTATSNGDDINDLLKNYSRIIGPLEKLKEYINKLEGKLMKRKEGSKWKKQ